MNQRKLAESVLTKVEKDKAYANITLSGLLGDQKNDNAFVSALVYGVLERKLTLDAIINKYSSRRIRDIDIRILNCLRIAVYQMVYMDKVSNYSAIDESVELAKSIGGKKQAGFVNAILRAAANDKNISKISFRDEMMGISRAYSVSVDIVKLLCKQYGIEGAKSYLKTTFGRPPVTVRVNTLKCSNTELTDRLLNEGVCVAKNNECENALNISDFGDITSLNAFQQGLFHVQDAASQICANALGAIKGDKILDMCAAPGGKTFTVVENMQNVGSIVSCDIHPHRVKLIEDGAKRLGLSIVSAIVNDASVYDADLGKFDRVLCDVPCSGTGVIRRKPEIRYKNLDDISQLAPIQMQILETASRYVKKGGILLYSTCSVLDIENGDITSAFLERHPEFELTLLFQQDEICQKTFLPNVDNTDGFYICKFLRK